MSPRSLGEKRHTSAADLAAQVATDAPHFFFCNLVHTTNVLQQQAALDVLVPKHSGSDAEKQRDA